jgi:hypothetical protein
VSVRRLSVSDSSTVAGAAASFDPDTETPAADEGEQSPDAVAMALAAPDHDDAETGPTEQPQGEST